MFRTIAILCLAMALGGMFAAGLAIKDAVTWKPGSDSVVMGTPASDDPKLTTGTVAPTAEIAANQPFLPIFGVAEVGTPRAEIRSAMPEKPKLSYQLKGVIASQSMKWAILSGAEGDVLVREGDPLGASGEITRIYPDGIEIDVGGETFSLTFSESGPVQVAAFEPDPDIMATSERPLKATPQDTPRPQRQEVIYQNMSSKEVLALLRDAERMRRERGWIPVDR